MEISTITKIMLWDFLIFYQIFLLPQVKQSAVISNKQGVYKLPHNLQNDSSLRILWNKGKSGKSQNFYISLKSSYISGGNLQSLKIKNLFFFGKWNFLALRLKKFFSFFRRELAKPEKKIRKLCSEEISCLLWRSLQSLHQ